MDCVVRTDSWEDFSCCYQCWLAPAQALANQSANQDLGDGRVMTHKGAVVLVVTKQGAYQYCYVNPIAPVLAEGRLNIDCTDDKPLGLGGFEHRLLPPSP